jgi:hypothetical protein
MVAVESFEVGISDDDTIIVTFTARVDRMALPFEVISRAGFIELIDMSRFSLDLRRAFLNMPVRTTGMASNPHYAVRDSDRTRGSGGEVMGDPFNRGLPFTTFLTSESLVFVDFLYGDGVIGAELAGDTDPGEMSLTDVTARSSGRMLGITIDGVVVGIHYVQAVTDRVQVRNPGWFSDMNANAIQIFLETGPLPFRPEVIRSERTEMD